MPGLIYFPGMIVSHYTVHSTEETKTRHASTKSFLPRDIAWRKNIESIRSCSTCAKEKISVLWQLLMPFLVKRTILFVLMSISMPELSTAAYSTLKLCRWVDLLNCKATYHFSLVRIHLREMNNGSLVFLQNNIAWRGLEATSWLDNSPVLAISGYFFGLDYVNRWKRTLFPWLHDCINYYRWSRAILSRTCKFAQNLLHNSFSTTLLC